MRGRCRSRRTSRAVGRIAAAKEFVERLQEQELAARIPDFGWVPPLAAEVTTCPACQHDVLLRISRVRVLSERLDDDEFVVDVVLVADSLDCDVCGLHLEGAAEVGAAALDQQYIKEERESAVDRFMRDHLADDYGND